MDDRFYYTLKQKLYIVDLAQNNEVWRLSPEFPKATLKQINH